VTSSAGFPVLVHGFTGSSASWGPRLIDGMAGAGLTPVLIDLPGHGADVGATDPARFTLAATLERIGRAGAWPADLIGYSMGGRIALHFAATHPDRVRRLVIESGSPGLATEGERAARRAADAELATRMVEEGIERFVEEWESQPLFGSRSRVDPATRATQRALRLNNDPRSLARALGGLGTGELPSLWERLERIETPTLLLVGELDTKYVAIAERMRGAMPRAQLVVVPGAGHTVHVEAPGAWLDAVIGFLTA
jgi:2-succinyl-6-hydroxy-2,4-cyclohexadiene-1-carboxylate synthase